MRKINPVFIPTGNENRRKLCDYCHIRYEWIDRGTGPRYGCPQCGKGATGDDLLNEQSNQLVAADVSEPLIASRKPKKEAGDSDLPQGAVWVSDEVINPE